jgi:hypothetical protein
MNYEELEMICEEASGLIEVLSRHLPGGTEKKLDTPLSGEPMSWPSFELFTPEYKSRAFPLDQPVRSYILHYVSYFKFFI